jgi:hypothetical protein
VVRSGDDGVTGRMVVDNHWVRSVEGAQAPCGVVRECRVNGEGRRWVVLNIVGAMPARLSLTVVWDRLGSCGG